MEEAEEVAEGWDACVVEAEGVAVVEAEAVEEEVVVAAEDGCEAPMEGKGGQGSGGMWREEGSNWK